MALYYYLPVFKDVYQLILKIFDYTKDFPGEKFFRDSKLCTIGEGTSEIQKLVFSRNVSKEF